MFDCPGSSSLGSTRGKTQDSDSALKAPVQRWCQRADKALGLLGIQGCGPVPVLLVVDKQAKEFQATDAPSFEHHPSEEALALALLKAPLCAEQTVAQVPRDRYRATHFYGLRLVAVVADDRVHSQLERYLGPLLLVSDYSLVFGAPVWIQHDHVSAGSRRLDGGLERLGIQHRDAGLLRARPPAVLAVLGPGIHPREDCDTSITCLDEQRRKSLGLQACAKSPEPRRLELKEGVLHAGLTAVQGVVIGHAQVGPARFCNQLAGTRPGEIVPAVRALLLLAGADDALVVTDNGAAASSMDDRADDRARPIQPLFLHHAGDLGSEEDISRKQDAGLAGRKGWPGVGGVLNRLRRGTCACEYKQGERLQETERSSTG